MLTLEKVNEMLFDLLETIDHDIAKDYNPDTSECPEDAEDMLGELRDIVGRYIEYEID